jgi:transcription-repair coupling factor (superfamily II helicase)
VSLRDVAGRIFTSADFVELRGLDERVQELQISAPSAVHPLVAGFLATPRPVGTGHPLLVITATGRQAQDVVAALHTWTPDLNCVDFPSWETLPHERLSPSLYTMGRRLAILHRLRHGDPSDPFLHPIDVVVASMQAVAQPLVSGLADLPVLRIRPGDEHDPEQLILALSELGYERIDLVERRGQYAVRGGIVDVFPATLEHPIRMEFWGDTVEEIRSFAVADQRSLAALNEGVLICAARELLLTAQVRQRAAELSAEVPAVAEMCTRLAEGIPVEGMEALSAALVPTMTSFIDLLPRGTHILVSQAERVKSRAIDLVNTAEEFLEASWHTTSGEAPLDLRGHRYATYAEVQDLARMAQMPWWELSELATDAEVSDSDVFTFAATELDSYRGDIPRALEDLRTWCSQQWTVALVSAGHGGADRFAESLRDADIPVSAEASPGVVQVATGVIEHGFVMPDFAVMTEADLLGQRASTKDMSRLPTRRRRSIDPLTLQPGDFVVHEQHGVGRYVEMIQRTVAGADREYVVLEYAASKRGQPPDRLYVPTDQLDLITRYIGGEAPSVHRLGGADWQRTKGRARKAVREIAAELIALYAARQAAQGHAFSPDSPWQAELEDAFAYVETPDQLACINEVKSDMEQVAPMDRLICGDVGYGKTEIAVRAAFKAVQDGKQVAILVPTTLLVQQHLATFGERYAAFPITIAGLSRFNTEAETRRAIEGVADGAIDVVIGTHRLLTPNVQFKDLGLVIVDEEQRFGVEHKEHLKALRTNVDVLAMSATPIPRTLEMAVTGIREMSVIQTPPEERHPVLTFVGPYDDKQIAAAIHRELLRDGQVFFVHNRVASIDRVAARLRTLVPEARIGTAHGQMGESALEQVIVDFWEKNIDVLVCTTIVESGIDIANANTLIVDRADTLGLAQLHQLRGRVGRGRERAYAYFTYPPEQSITETAHERLATIAQHSELGSGMHIALKDLEIRGAGNLLGGQQSGHIADVGFDLYVRLVGEALAEAKGEVPVVAEAKVELPVDAYIPHGYVPHERLRLEAYRRLAGVLTEADVDEIERELTDRYGSPPDPVQTLLAVARFRVLCRAAGITECVAQGANIRFAPVQLPESAQLRVNRLYPGTMLKEAVRTMLVPRPRAAEIGGQPVRDRPLLEWATQLVETVLLPTRSDAMTGAQ